MITPTDWQGRVMELPEEYSLALMGGKAGGKTTCATLLALRHAEQYKGDARTILIRSSHKALTDVELALEQLLNGVYGKAVKLNRQEHLFRLPNGARIELGQLDGPQDLIKWSGKSVTQCIFDEYGHVRDRRWIDELKAGLRSPNQSIPLRTILLANPGGAQHAFCHSTYIAKQRAWTPYQVNGETFITCPSTVLDNPHLDPTAYLQKLRSAVGNDEDLYRALAEGDWNIARGAYFGEVLDQNVHQIRADFPYDISRGWRPFISMDYGYSAPSIIYVCVRSPGPPTPFPYNSLILVAELATHDPNDLNQGLKWPPGKLCEAIKDLCEEWKIQPVGIGDDCFGLDKSLLQIFRENGVYLRSPRKERIKGWSKMREMLFNAKERNGKPGMWVSESCKYFWATVPFIQRDPSRPEDCLTTGPDHAADSARFACQEVHNYARSGSLGMGGIW